MIIRVESVKIRNKHLRLFTDGLYLQFKKKTRTQHPRIIYLQFKKSSSVFNKLKEGMNCLNSSIAVHIITHFPEKILYNNFLLHSTNPCIEFTHVMAFAPYTPNTRTRTHAHTRMRMRTRTREFERRK